MQPVAGRAGRKVGAGSVFLGLGLGGFFDGIVLHQVLQWHHMISGVVPPNSLGDLETNTLADGLFHLGTYTFTLVGLAFLWIGLSREHRPVPTTLLLGGLLLGWGLFNLIEGTVNHHLLQVHHVRPGANQLWWDLSFLAWGGVMTLAGVALMRSGARAWPGLPGREAE